MKLYIIPLSLSRQKLVLFVNNKKVANFSWKNPLETDLKKITTNILKINIREGRFKNHYFQLQVGHDKLLYLKKKFDVFGTRMQISEQKNFDTLIAWKNEKR